MKKRLWLNVVETTNDSILFNDQGTEIEIEGLNLEEALNMDLQVLEFMTTGWRYGGYEERGMVRWSAGAAQPPSNAKEMEIRQVKAFRSGM